MGADEELAKHPAEHMWFDSTPRRSARVENEGHVLIYCSLFGEERFRACMW